MQYQFNFQPVWQNFDKLVEGLLLGLGLAAVSLVIGMGIGLVCAFARLSRWRLSRVAAWTYVEIFRNSPILLLLFFVYFGLPELGIHGIDKYGSFILALSLYSGGYLAEIFRTGLISVSRHYTEAAKAIGLTPLQQKIYVVLPVTFRIILPSLGNNLISLFKDTSLATAIAIPELTFQAREINTFSFRVVEAWLTASIFYLITCYSIAGLLRFAERKYRLFQ